MSASDGPTLREPMRSVRRARPAALAALAAIAVVPACSGGSAPSAVAETTPPPDPTTTTTQTAATSASSLAPVTTPAPTTAPTTAPPTTLAPATTTSTAPPITITSGTRPVQETEPITPPGDEYAAEPVIDMGTLAIPKLGVEMTMFEGIRLSTLDHGPGHWPGTATPGQVGNVVVAGHRTSKHRVFRDVDQLVEGDEIVFTDAAGTHTYAVRDVQIVEPTALWIVDPTDTPTATLFACHPPGSTAQRIVVFADLVTE